MSAPVKEPFDSHDILEMTPVRGVAPGNGTGCDCLDPSDAALRYVGLSDVQIETLHTFCEQGGFTLAETNDLRATVEAEALRLLMERPSGGDSLREDLGLISQ